MTVDGRPRNPMGALPMLCATALAARVCLAHVQQDLEPGALVGPVSLSVSSSPSMRSDTAWV